MRPPAKNRLAEVPARTLVVIGERDLADDQLIANVLAARIPQARTFAALGAGHLVGLYAREAQTQAITGVLD